MVFLSLLFWVIRIVANATIANVVSEVVVAVVVDIVLF